MTKSTITRERLQEIAEDGFLKHGESKELARMALGAMDSEPVAWMSKGGTVLNGMRQSAHDFSHYSTPLYRHAQPAPGKPVGVINGAREPVLYGEHIGIAIGTHLYAEPQPAPVVQCPFPCGWDNLNKLAIQDAALVARGLVEGELTTEAHRQAAISNNDRLLKVISACRAAMLQAEPVTTANKLPELIEGMEVSIDVSTCDADAGNRYFGTVAELSELDGAKNGYILLVQDAKPNFNQNSNSPVIQDGSEHCPCCGKKLRRACSVEGCGGKHVAHGLCKKHYDMKRWEDPEQVRKFREAGKRYRRKTKSAAAAPQEVKP